MSLESEPQIDCCTPSSTSVVGDAHGKYHGASNYASVNVLVAQTRWSPPVDEKPSSTTRRDEFLFGLCVPKDTNYVIAGLVHHSSPNPALM